jgi:hypothetical protein
VQLTVLPSPTLTIQSPEPGQLALQAKSQVKSQFPDPVQDKSQLSPQLMSQSPVEGQTQSLPSQTQSPSHPPSLSSQEIVIAIRIKTRDTPQTT